MGKRFAGRRRTENADLDVRAWSLPFLGFEEQCAGLPDTEHENVKVVKQHAYYNS